ncbi:hypothetical protein [Leptothrix ochracea]|uniref:hypothetical protein n=1 Tax=Leptothrix ochracea TaxID=735331 RepID=UPI0034E2828D
MQFKRVLAPWVIAGAAVAALTACGSNALSTAAAVVSLVDPAQLDQLKPGLSTIADAIKLLGPAASQTTQPDGNQLMQWKLPTAAAAAKTAATTAATSAATTAMTNAAAQSPAVNNVSMLFDSAGKMLSLAKGK